jgi:murein DD-endopeptidase MepM/ murein hydrolase activator NlpD
MGNDLVVPKTSDKYSVRAIESGTVTQIMKDFYTCNGSIDYILIKNDSDGTYNGYGEIDPESYSLNEGDHVNGGQIFATVSHAGCGMIHFERPKTSPRPDAYDYDKFDDPMPYLKTTSENCSISNTP